MKYTKYLFLDVDGVLNHRDWYKNLNGNDLSYPFRDFDTSCVERVNDILEETGARLVLISNWRLDANIKDILYSVGLPSIFDCTPYVPGKPRGYEIIKYFEEHDIDWKNTNYVIIDDCNDFSKCQQKHFIQTAYEPFEISLYKQNGGCGLTDACARRAIKILNNM